MQKLSEMRTVQGSGLTTTAENERGCRSTKFSSPNTPPFVICHAHAAGASGTRRQERLRGEAEAGITLSSRFCSRVELMRISSARSTSCIQCPASATCHKGRQSKRASAHPEQGSEVAVCRDADPGRRLACQLLFLLTATASAALLVLLGRQSRLQQLPPLQLWNEGPRRVGQGSQPEDAKREQQSRASFLVGRSTGGRDVLDGMYRETCAQTSNHQQ